MKFEHFKELRKHPLTSAPMLRLECVYQTVNQLNIELGKTQITDGDIAELKVNMEDKLRASMERELTNEVEFDVIKLGKGEIKYIIHALSILHSDERRRITGADSAIIDQNLRELDKLLMRFRDMGYKIEMGSK